MKFTLTVKYYDMYANSYGQNKVYIKCQVSYDMYTSGYGQEKVYINC